MTTVYRQVIRPEDTTDKGEDRPATLNGSCCMQVTHAWFVNTNLARIGRRHTGPYCAGITNIIDYRSWRAGRIVAA